MEHWEFYIYEIKRNGIAQYKHVCFPSLKAAYDHFMEHYASNHYGKEKFVRSHAISSSLVNKNRYPGVNEICVQFYKKKIFSIFEWECDPVPYNEWSYLCKKENVDNEC